MAIEEEYPPRVLSSDEIEMYVKGDREEVDRLILYSLNRIASVLIPHAKREDVLISRLNALGGFESIAKRTEFVDALIEKNNARSKMMEKVNQSVLVWALIAFIGFVMHAMYSDFMEAVKNAISVSKGIKP